MKTFIGHHGTSDARATKILIDDFNINQKTIGWIGTGIYFFEDEVELTRAWAKYRHGDIPIRILSCEICVPAEKVFNVVDPKSIDSKRFHITRDDFIRSLSEHQLNVFAKNKNECDGKIFNMICIKEKYVLVRACTYTFSEVDRSFRIFSRIPNGIELCLRNKAYIKEKKII